MEKTIKLKLDLLEKDKETLRQTMTMSNKVFNEIAAYGFEHHICSKVSVHKATYYSIRSKYPEIPSSILQGIRDVACETLKGLDLKKLPVSKQYSAVRYNKLVCNINLHKNNVTLASIKGRVKGAFPIPEYYKQYLSWELRTFRCLKCGFQIHADLNAARNIAFIGKTDIGRLTVTQPYITCNDTGVGILVEHSDNAPVFIDRG